MALTKKDIEILSKAGVNTGDEELPEEMTDEEMAAFEEKAPEPEEGFASRATKSASAWWQKQKGITESAYKGEMTVPQASVPLQSLSAAASLVTDLTGNAMGAAYRAAVPQEARESISKVGSDLMDSEVGKAAVDLLKAGGERWAAFEQKYPEFAKDVASTANLALTLTGGDKAGGGVKAAKAATVKAGEAAGAAMGARTAAGAASKAASEATKLAEYVAPALSREVAERAAAKGAEGVAAKGIIKAAKVKLTEAEHGLADAVRGVVDVAKTLPENVTAVKEAIAQVGQERVVPLLKKFDGPIKKTLISDKLGGVLSKIPEGFLLKAEQVKAAESIVAMAKRIAAKAGQTRSGLYEARKAFDDAVERAFGDGVLRTDEMRNVRDYVARNARRVMNDLVSEGVPDRQFQNLMDRMTKMFRVGDNLKDKLAEEIMSGKGKAGEFFDTKPGKMVKAAAATIPGAAAAGRVINVVK